MKIIKSYYTEQEIKSKPIEVLKRRKDEIQLRLVDKQGNISRYRDRIMQLEKNCSDLRNEYRIIDRVVFLRENCITKLSTGQTKRDKKQEASIKQKIEDLSASEASDLLHQLLAIQKRRQR